MELTPEQYDIIHSSGDIKINAVAGSGKTTTMIEYARSRPPGSKILYLAFNKVVKLEASKKFREKGLNNVQVETAHSLAFRHIVMGSHYKIRTQGYKTHEIAELLNLKSTGEKHTEYILANHVNKFITYFCNSEQTRVQDLNYLDIVVEPQARNFVSNYYEQIQMQTRLFLAKMDKAEIEIPHDFYLKKFQLSKPRLNYDYILFDEGQDASPAMLDIFFRQTASKVIVGDTHQQIYAWRFAVNSLEKADFKSYQLSTSFRFNQSIADLAMEVLSLKRYLQPCDDVEITGAGESKAFTSKATLARTNLGLLLSAITYITERKKVKHIYFEGNINSYTYADDGASLYDVLHLFNQRHFLVKDKLIKSMQNLNELEEYIEKTEDMQLGMMLEIVKEYGNEIPNIMKALKQKHVENDEKEKAEMIFSTVHRCKGMEYDEIFLVEDFISEDKLEKLTAGKKKEDINVSRLIEEINLLYVAITRTKRNIHIPESLLPVEYPESEGIYILDNKQTDTNKTGKAAAVAKGVQKEKAYNLEAVREKHNGAYKPWTAELDNELTQLFLEDKNLQEMAQYFGRTIGAVASRIKKLELGELYG